MAELRVTFNPVEAIGAPVVKKVIIKNEFRILVKLDGETNLKEFATNYMQRDHIYRLGESQPHVASCSWARAIRSVHFSIYGGPHQNSTYKDFTTPIFHYVAAGETAVIDPGTPDVIQLVPIPNAAFKAQQFQARLTFVSHHFVRSLPPGVTPRLLSRHHDFTRTMANISTAEATENHRYDNSCNYFRALIGFLWRDCQRFIDRAKTVPEGAEPVKTISQIETLVESLEHAVMRQPVHAEHRSHAVGHPRDDMFVYHWLADHDESVWTDKFDNKQIWLADEDTNPTELVYDIKAQHTDDQDTVDTAALASEEAAILVHGFNQAFSSPNRDMGYTDRTIYLP